MVLLALALIGCHHDEVKQEEVPPPGLLSIDVPAAGEWLSAGERTAEGTGAGVEDVALNGSAATLSDGDWTAPLTLARGIDVLEATATDLRGDPLFVRQAVLAGTFANPDGPIEDAAILRVNRGGLDRIEALVEDLIVPDLLNGSLASLNPVYEDSYGVWGWDAVTIAADVLQVQFDPATIELGTTATELTLTATLPDIQVDIRAYGDVIGFDFDENVYIGASSAVIGARVFVLADDGRLDVQLNEVTVDLRDFWYDTDILPGEVEDYLLVETIRDALEGMLVEKVTEMVPPLLDETLAGLDPSFETEMVGVPVSAAFAFADVDTDEEGLVLTLDVEVSVPTAGSHTYAGFLTAGDGTPELDTHSDLSGALSDDLLNRVLFEAWRGGVLDIRLSTDDGSLEGAMLAPFKADQGTIAVDPVLPPVIIERDGALLAQAGEILVTIDTPGGDLGEHLVAAVNLEVGLELLIEDGELVVELGEPTIVLTVRESDWGASNETTTRLLEENLPIDALLLLLGDLSFPLPTLYGVGFDEGSAARDDDGVHTTVEIELQ